MAKRGPAWRQPRAVGSAAQADAAAQKLDRDGAEHEKGDEKFISSRYPSEL